MFQEHIHSKNTENEHSEENAQPPPEKLEWEEMKLAEV